MPMVLTVLEARVAAGREADLRAAYRDSAQGPFPPGLVSSSLLRLTADQAVWRIATLWASSEAMRGKGTPRGVQIFQAAGAQPTLSILEVVDELAPNRSAA